MLGTTYDVDMIAAVDFLTREKGLRAGDTIGHVYFEGDYGAGALEGSSWAAGKAGLKVTGLKIKATDTDLSAQVSALRTAGVKAVLVSAGPAADRLPGGRGGLPGSDVPVVSSAPGFAPQLMRTPRRPRSPGRSTRSAPPRRSARTSPGCGRWPPRTGRSSPTRRSTPVSCPATTPPG